MVGRWILVGCVLVLAGWSSLSGALAAERAAERNTEQLMITIRVYEVVGEGDDQRQKILAEPTIIADSGRSFSFKSGGKVQPKSFGDELEIGTQVNGKMERVADGVVRVTLTVQLSTTVGQEDDAATDVLKTDTVQLRSVFASGELKRVKCGERRWCEVRVEPAR